MILFLFLGFHTWVHCLTTGAKLKCLRLSLVSVLPVSSSSWVLRALSLESPWLIQRLSPARLSVSKRPPYPGRFRPHSELLLHNNGLRENGRVASSKKISWFICRSWLYRKPIASEKTDTAWKWTDMVTHTRVFLRKDRLPRALFRKVFYGGLTFSR